MSNFLPGYFHAIPGYRKRLLGALLLGLVVGLSLPANHPATSRAILGWDTTTILYLAFTLIVFFRHNTADALKGLAAREDQNRWIIVTAITIACFISLIAIGTLLTNLKTLSPLAMHLHVVLGAVTVVASWSMMHMVFAVHYAHEYYGDTDSSPDSYEAYQGLIFPGHKEPVFSDFMYYAFIIGMTCQVSDVQVASQATRRLTLTHGVLAFFFNTVVLALSVNIAAGLLS